MARCENCANALIGKSRVVESISGTERLVSDWVIERIDCTCNRKTSIYGEVTCSDYKEMATAKKNKMGDNKTPHWTRRRYMSNGRLDVDMLVCSVCKAEFSFDYETGVGAGDWNFCPNCGAKMKRKG